MTPLPVPVPNPHCWTADAAATWSAFHELPIVKVVVRESHFGVVVRRCATCGQHQASVSGEVTFSGPSGDQRSSTHIPLSPPEADALLAADDTNAERILRAFPPRPTLVEAGTGPRFASAVVIPPHE